MPKVEDVEPIERLAPKTLIDVGANKGQFSVVARLLFPDIEIHAFEPLEGELVFYRSVVREPVKIYQMALGATAGEAKFFVTSRVDSSSLLPPDLLTGSAYRVTTTRSITVPMARLSDVLDFSILPRPILLKLDVQGGELEVLKGAESILPFVETIYCEVSFVSLYKDQPLAGEIATFLLARGFFLRGVFNPWVTKEFGQTQADFLFSRNVEVSSPR